MTNPKDVTDTSKEAWYETSGMVYTLVEAKTGWENGERPLINGYVINFSHQKSSGATLEGQNELQSSVLSFLRIGIDENIKALAAARDALQVAVKEMREALDTVLKEYVDLIDCGDCGNWDSSKEESVIAARAALAKSLGET